MVRRPEQTFFQRGNADGQQAHEKMLNITNDQGRANQNHNEISPHTCQDGYHQKEHKEWEKIVANHIFNKVCYLEYIKGSCNSKANKLNNST